MIKMILTLLFLLCHGIVYGQTVVVVAKDSSISELNSQHVANIFLARTNRFPNGEKAAPIELKNQTAREGFYQQISGKSPRQLNAYWTTLVFTGKGKPPKGYPHSADLLFKLNNQSGAITYIADTQVTDEMKVVYRFP